MYHVAVTLASTAAAEPTTFVKRRVRVPIGADVDGVATAVALGTVADDTYCIVDGIWSLTSSVVNVAPLATSTSSTCWRW